MVKTIKFCGYTWDIKNSKNELVGPGPSLYSDSDENVYVDPEGLHLKTTIIDKQAYAAEVNLNKPLGYGKYEFTLHCNLNNLEENHVLGAFLYEDDNKEIDIEFSKKMVGKNKGQYVVQPWKVKGNLYKFKIPKILKSKHSINWKPDYIEFISRNAVDNKLINKVKYTGKHIPKESKALMIFNLWLHRGRLPFREEEVIISSFSFIKMEPLVI